MAQLMCGDEMRKRLEELNGRMQTFSRAEMQRRRWAGESR